MEQMTPGTRKGPFCGMKKASDWSGKKVRTTKETSNGWTDQPAGLLARVQGQPARGHIHIRSNPCECCKVAVHISLGEYSDIELIDPTEYTMPSARPQPT